VLQSKALGLQTLGARIRGFKYTGTVHKEILVTHRIWGSDFHLREQFLLQTKQVILRLFRMGYDISSSSDFA